QYLTVEILPLAGIANQGTQLVVVEVLGNVVIGAVLHRLHGGFNLLDGRDHQDLDEAVILLDDPQHFEAADSRQPDVQQHQVDIFAIEDRQRRLAATDAQYAILPLQD